MGKIKKTNDSFLFESKQEIGYFRRTCNINVINLYTICGKHVDTGWPIE